MNEEDEQTSDMVDTTDCLEAVGVIREWKNFLFILLLFCLLALQGSFWLVDSGVVKADCDAKPIVRATKAEKPADADVEIEQAAEKIVAEANQPTETVPKPKGKKLTLPFRITFAQVSWVVTFLNFIAIPAAVLYCLTMLFCLKVSMLGRFGGINHIVRAFFISLVFAVLLMPWQKFFGSIVAGSIFTPRELLESVKEISSGDIFDKALYYARFTGYCLLELLLLICSQIRSIRWTKATLRRLEVI